jgi:hypothetical protein
MYVLVFLNCARFFHYDGTVNLDVLRYQMGTIPTVVAGVHDRNRLRLTVR